MRKYLLFTILIIFGAIIGGIGISIFCGRVASHNAQIAELENISELENLAFKIYKTGDFNSSIIALNYLSDKLEFCKERSSKNPNCDTFITDLGLTHARLFLLYETNGKQDLAEQEYQTAIELIGGEFKVGSQEELKELIKKIDKSANIDENKLISIADFGGLYYGYYYKDNNGIYLYLPPGMCEPNCPEEEKQYPDYYLKNGMCNLASPICPFRKLEADPSSFEVIGIVKGLNSESYLFAKDGNYVFKYSQKLDNVSGKNFQFIYDKEKRALYAKDDSNVFMLYNDDLGGKGSLDNWIKLENSDPKTFTFYEYTACQSTRAKYAKDKNNAYFGARLIEEADGSSFEYVALGVAKDKNNVYFLGNKVANADPMTIRYVPDSDNSCNTTYFEDKNYKYNCFNECKIIEIK